MAGRVVVGAAAAALGAGVVVVALVLGLVAAHGATSCATVGYLNLAPLVVEAPDDVDAVAVHGVPGPAALPADELVVASSLVADGVVAATCEAVVDTGALAALQTP
ncbi:hypothetical protein [Isoptericola variabilis]|uniref:Uncharacterized protein n=1 Tax=Isoptericola variabilis (strain 225) TaxID=743718 RepID=F6FW61_ISOV2|nr:hypothetical protein [Isoptericola variabilis]AEG45605.1 hypothetical protein Isova_2920 [Isoptericola variabilis 225]TWH25787.1 hypothetical protein L600_000900000370 [Isoptericola variabilis J7]